MFIVSNRPDWVPGNIFSITFQTLEEAQEWVRDELGFQAQESIEGTYYVREVDLGEQLKYTSKVDVTINATAYPEA